MLILNIPIGVQILALTNHAVTRNTSLCNAYAGYRFRLKEPSSLHTETCGVFNLWFLCGLMMALSVETGSQYTH
jgi:hypothetical protein